MLFGVDIKGLVLGALGGKLMTCTLHSATLSDGDFGEEVSGFTPTNGQGMRLNWDSKLALARGYPADAAKILILQDGEIAEPKKGIDEITIDGRRFRIIDVQTDPVNATWVLAAELVPVNG